MYVAPGSKSMTARWSKMAAVFVCIYLSSSPTNAFSPPTPIGVATKARTAITRRGQSNFIPAGLKSSGYTILRSEESHQLDEFPSSTSETVEAEATPDPTQQPPKFVKSPDEIERIAKTLQTNVLFSEASQKIIDELVQAFEKVSYQKGDEIVRQGDTEANFMLILDQGECAITIDGKQVPEPYGTMKKGSMLGELALLYDSGRAATVTAKTPILAFRLHKHAFDYFMKQIDYSNRKAGYNLKTEIKRIDKVIDNISGVKTKYGGSIIRKFRPSRIFLWTQWSGTVLQHAWKSALGNMLVSAAFIVFVRTKFQPPWPLGVLPDTSFPFISRLLGLGKLWHYLMTISTFILTFFLSQAYGLWREMYSVGRRVQGRMNDIGLVLASTAKRDKQGRFTKESEKLLDNVASYSRLFHAFMWAKYTSKLDVLATPRGMSRMLSRGLLTREQYNVLSSANPGAQGAHNSCIQWILIQCLAAMKAGTLPNDHSIRHVLFEKILALRSTYATTGDLLDGRIPLAYAHFVQILVDAFLILAPFALYSELGVWSLPAVGLLTLFYSGLLDLAKILLDPLDNDNFYKESVNMDIGVLIRESNAGSTRWKYASERVPSAMLPEMLDHDGTG